MDNYYRLFLDNIDFPVWIESLDTSIIYLNKAYEEMYKVSFSSLKGKTNLEAFSREIAETFNSEIELCVKQNKALTFDGSLDDKILECKMFPIHNSQNKLVAVGGIILDITSKRKSETDIEKQKDILRTIIDAVPESIFYKDTESRFIGFNKKFEDFYTELGVTKILGKSDLEIYPDKKIAQGFIDLDKEIMANKTSYRYQYTAPNPDGTIRIEESIKVPVLDSNGKAWGVVGLARDITTSKNLEEKLRYLSYTDILTGLYNRSSFEEKISELNTEENMPLGIIMGDVNGLKLVNDTLGHLEGDKFLTNISNVLTSCIDDNGFVFRWGGDEFVILLPNCNESFCEEMICKINEACENHSYEFINLSIALGDSIKHTIEEDIYTCVKEVEEKVYRRKLLEKKSVRSSVIDSLKKGLEEKNLETQEHTDRVAQFAYMIGKKLNFNIATLDELFLVANFHDIGKIGINEEILLKPSKLTDEEYTIMKSHSEKGYRIINALGELENVAKCVLAHHERYDGKGYPLGLYGDDIPLISRIISIVDSYDVMTNERPYKKPMLKEDAISELRRCSGTQFDPNLVEIFIDILNS